MEKKRNGLLEVYRLFFCFWVMYFHDFLFLGKTGDFSGGYLGVEFFFILSGFFLMRSMRKFKDERIMEGVKKLVGSRLKTMAMPLLVCIPFNLICATIFFLDDFIYSFGFSICYLWYILYLVIGIVIFYLLYRWIKQEKGFIIVLNVLAVAMCAVHFSIGSKYDYYAHYSLFGVRMLWTMSVGMLLSYVPQKALKWKNFNVYTLLIPIVVAVLFYLAYIPKTYGLHFVMVVLFVCLIYISSTVNVGGKFFDYIGKLSVRMYIYMALLCMLSLFGLVDYRILFLIDLVVSNLDLWLSKYYQKWPLFQKMWQMKGACTR